MNKKIVAALLAVAMVLGLAACGGSSDSASTGSSETASTPAATETVAQAENSDAEPYSGDKELAHVGFIGWGYTDGLGSCYQRCLEYAAPYCGFDCNFTTYSSYDEVYSKCENLIQAGCNIIEVLKATTAMIDLCEANGVYLGQWGSPIDITTDDGVALLDYLNQSDYWVGTTSCDDIAAGYEAVMSLHERGCNNFFLIGTAAGNYCHDLRFTGMYKALDELGLKAVNEFRSSALATEGTAAIQNQLAITPEMDAIIASGASGGTMEMVLQTLDTEGRTDILFGTLDIQPNTGEYMKENLAFIGGGQGYEVMFLAINAMNMMDGAYEAHKDLVCEFVYLQSPEDYDNYEKYVDGPGIVPFTPEELQSITYRCNPDATFEALYKMWNEYDLPSMIEKWS